MMLAFIYVVNIDTFLALGASEPGEQDWDFTTFALGEVLLPVT